MQRPGGGDNGVFEELKHPCVWHKVREGRRRRLKWGERWETLGVSEQGSDVLWFVFKIVVG